MIFYAFISPATGVIRMSGRAAKRGDAISSCPDGYIPVYPERIVDPATEEWDLQANAPRSKAAQGQSLENVRAKAFDDLQSLVRRKRQTFLTDLPGQDQLYADKEAEARKYLSLPILPAVLSNFPLLEREVGITATTPRALAQMWVSRADSCRNKMAHIEAERMRAKSAITNATTIAAVEQAISAAKSALSNI